MTSSAASLLTAKSDGTLHRTQRGGASHTLIKMDEEYVFSTKPKDPSHQNLNGSQIHIQTPNTKPKTNHLLPLCVALLALLPLR